VNALDLATYHRINWTPQGQRFSDHKEANRPSTRRSCSKIARQHNCAAVFVQCGRLRMLA